MPDGHITQTRTNGRGLGGSRYPRDSDSHAPYPDHLANGANRGGRCHGLAQQQSVDTVAQDGHSEPTPAIYVTALDGGHASSTGRLRAEGVQKLWTKEESKCYSGLAEHDSAKGDDVSDRYCYYYRGRRRNEWSMASVILNESSVIAKESTRKWSICEWVDGWMDEFMGWMD